MENKKVSVTEVIFRNGSCANKSPIKEFFESINNKLRTEFEETINKYEGSEEYLFYYGERTLLGLYANAIIRNDREYNCIALQEYRVKNIENDFKGRCDLLVTAKLNNVTADFIFEAKKVIYCEKEYDKVQQDLTREYIDKCFYQGENYFKSEKAWRKPTYIVVLIFDFINLKDWPNGQKEFVEYKPDDYKDNVDFYSFFYIEGTSGLGIYGKVYPMNNI